MNTITNSAPSLFDDGQIGSGKIVTQTTDQKSHMTTNLIDLLYDGFYIVFC